MGYKELVTMTVLAHASNYSIGTKTKEYIVLHFTANDGDSDESNANYFQTANRKASANLFVDDDSITLSVPLEDTAWHCYGSLYSDYKQTGGATLRDICTNSNSIGIEMCDTNKNGVYDLSDLTRKNTIKLVVALMEDYNIDINHVVRHFDCSGKYCPRYFCPPYGSNDEWDKFKAEILEEYNKETGSNVTPSTPQPSTPAQPIVEMSGSDCNYTIQVFVDDLNIRTQPSMNGSIVGQTGKGVFTIVKETNGWGLLKSGAGWVYLDNTKYVTRLNKTVSTPAPTPVTPTLKSNEEIVTEIYKGLWGNGEDRKTRLTAAGYDYSTIQAIINGKANVVSKPTLKSNETIAKEVRAGKWGNGTDRKNRLTAAGYEYSAIQKLVNSMS